MGIFLNFGERVDNYDYKVINERDARASAGIMFLLGLLSLFSVYILRTIFWAELFSITFILEFAIRIVINPKYAPYMLIGGLIVHNQTPDWVEAKPKRFAWSLGLVLGLIMTYFIVFDIISPVRIGICWLCLFLLFLESVFGICLGCILYKKLNWKLYNCPGGICDVATPRKYNIKNYFFILGFMGLFYLTYLTLKHYKISETPNIIIIDE